MSGAGLPASPSAVAVIPSTTTPNRSPSPAASSTRRAFFDDDTTACGTPAASSRSITAIDPGYGAIPSESNTSLKTTFLRFPIAQIVWLPGGSVGSPSGSSIPREWRNALTPS